MIKNIYHKIKRRYMLRRKRLHGHYKSDAKITGRVLISYLSEYATLPDSHPLFSYHSNRWESKEIIRLFNELGFVVDVINYQDFAFIPRKKYDVLFDIHMNIERLSSYMPETLKIYHATGAHWLFQNRAEFERLYALKVRRNKVLMPRRIVKPIRSIEMADAVTCFGNDFTRSTYSHINDKLYPVSISSSVIQPKYREKNFNLCRRNFLWLGSSGLVHKGLDLVLEAFTKLPEYNLYVCGPIEGEQDFVECYQRELYQTQNIKTLHWVDINSADFSSLVQRCLGIVYPSCSEGCPGSVINCMHWGLIPIVSIESAIDTGDFGITLPGNSSENLMRTISHVSSMPLDKLQEMSIKAIDYIQKKHLREHFTISMKRALEEILKI